MANKHVINMCKLLQISTYSPFKSLEWYFTSFQTQYISVFLANCAHLEGEKVNKGEPWPMNQLEVTLKQGKIYELICCTKQA